MIFLLSSLVFVWFTRTLKTVLFWLYLWQLKEYHIPRFIDHFRTVKGKKILFGAIPTIKYILFILLLVSLRKPNVFTLVFCGLLATYCVESVLFIFGLAKNLPAGRQGNVKKPVPTLKTILLTSISFIITGLYAFATAQYITSFFWIIFALLAFDILTPVIISLVVLLVQPFFVAARNRILAKAKAKMATFKNLTVIGITGSFGKTSTKEFLTTILSEKFNVISTKEHQNSEMGIAKCILENVTDKHEVFVVEMGSYAKGGIKLLCDMVKPSIGIVTGVNEQHLALFGSLENLLSAEGGQELVNALPENGLIVVNGENKYCLDLYKQIDAPLSQKQATQLRKKIYALGNTKINADIWTEGVAMHQDRISFIALLKEVGQAKKEMAHFEVNVLGQQHIENILGATLVAHELGMSLQEIADATKDIRPGQAGMTIKTGIHGINIIDSSYSSNPDGVMADLNYLNVFKGKRVVIMPCLIELGQKSIQAHIEIGKKIAQTCDLAIITTKDKFQEIRNGAIINGMNPEKIAFLEDPKDIFHVVTTFCTAGDAILLEGRVPNELMKLLNSK